MLLMLEPSSYIALTESIATAVTAVAALAALVYARGQIQEAQKQLQHSHKISHGDFLLRLDEAFQRHIAVHKLLQPMFKWGNNKGGPVNDEDWFLVTSYMGLLERVNYLVESGVVGIEIIDKLYGYRVYNIVANDAIRKAKLEDPQKAVYYEEFIKLWLKLKGLHNTGTRKWRDYPAVVVVDPSGADLKAVPRT